MKNILSTTNSKAIFLIRISVGFIFLSEGIQKFILPVERGAGRFEKLGVFYPEFMGSCIGTIEIVCGIMILIGFYTRIAAVFTGIIMLFAMYYTQLPILLEEGFWAMANRIRTDWSMFFSSLFLLYVGAGYWSIDYKKTIQ
jgi:putative oxidoreductase